VAGVTECVFCRIIGRELPAKVVSSSPAAVAFLDVAPLAPGHLLVVPREHARHLHELPAAGLSGLAAELPKLAAALLQVTGADGYNLLQNNGAAAGQVVEHVHFHMIPRRPGDGLGFRWPAKQYRAGESEEILERFKLALAG